MTNEDDAGSPVLRDGLRVAAYTGAALAVPTILRRLAATPSRRPVERHEETDILVIGGGAAGIHAALRARAEGHRVTLLDKGTVGCSGLSPWAGGMSYFDPAKSDRAAWHDSVAHLGEHLNRRDWLDLFIDRSKPFFERLDGLGIVKGNIVERGRIYREMLLAQDVALIERLMVTSLLRTSDGQVAGAVGFHYDDSIAEMGSVIVTARAVILCTGPATFKAPGFPAWGQTGDGDAIAYAAGASISGKEFADTHMTFARYPAASWENWGPGMGDFMANVGMANRENPFMLDLNRYLQAARGISDTLGTGGPPGSFGSPGGPRDPRARGKAPPPPPPGAGAPPAPIVLDMEKLGTRMVGGSTNGMAPHKAEGVFCADLTGAADGVAGLYAAGDALSSMLVGATYSMGGTSYLGSCIQGDHVATHACNYAKAIERPVVDRAEIEEKLTALWRYRARHCGYRPQWVAQVLRNAMMPYYVLYIKSPGQMSAALTTVTYLRDHCLPRLHAEDGHALRQAHEVQHMLLNAEMKLRAGLYRTESRGTHFRDDYPARDDAEWLCWVKIRQQDGAMTLDRHPIPRAWHPDAELAYRARYPNAFPGEDAFRADHAIA